MSATFFTDRDLGQQFPDILRAAGIDVVRHSAVFLPETPDEEWLQRVAGEGWIAITHDRRIRYKPNELSAVDRHGARVLVVVGAAPFSDLARNFVSTLPTILSFVSAQSAPFIGKVYRPAPAEFSKDPSAPGRVELWYPR